MMRRGEPEAKTDDCRIACAAAAALATVLILPPAARAAVPVTVVAATGRAAPGTEAGTAFGRIDDRVALNASGDVVFSAALTGPAVTAANANALWTSTGGVPLLAVRGGSPAPGAAPGATFYHFYFPNINAVGDVAFLADLRGASPSADAGIWAGKPGAVSPVAVEGSIAPGGPQAKPFVVAVFSTGEFWTPFLNAQGKVAFRGLVGDPGDVFSNRSGVWTNAPGALTQVAREGTPAPGDPGGAAFTFLRRPGINATGTLAFSGQTSTGGDLYVGDANAQTPAAIRGQTPVPGVAGATFTSTFNEDPSINAAGEITFPGTIQGPGVTDANNQGIWAGPPSALRLVARTGSAAPGAPGSTLAQFGQPFINRNGQAAFTGIVVNGTGESSAALFVGGSQSTLALVAAEGAQAPGTDSGDVFFTVGTPALNAAGDVAFLGTVRGPGVTSQNRLGIWEGDASTLHLVARQGDLIDIDGLLKTIDTLGLSTGAGGEDGRPTGLNEAGQVAFYAHFTDGTDAVLVTPVPEPAALAPLLAVIGVTLPRRQRRGPRTLRILA